MPDSLRSHGMSDQLDRRIAELEISKRDGRETGTRVTHYSLFIRHRRASSLRLRRSNQFKGNAVKALKDMWVGLNEKRLR